jgi:hypothetical protein
MIKQISIVNKTIFRETQLHLNYAYYPNTFPSYIILPKILPTT